MTPITPVSAGPPARPQKSSHKRPLSKGQEAKRAALQKSYDIKRRFPLKQNFLPLHNGVVPPTPLPNLHQPAVKVVEETVHDTSDTTVYQPQLRIPNILPNAEHTSPAFRAPMDTPKAQQKPLRQYQGGATRGFTVIRDIYQLPNDEPADDNIEFKELRTNSQSEEPAPSSSPTNFRSEHNEPAPETDIQAEQLSQGDMNVLKDEGQPEVEKEACSDSEIGLDDIDRGLLGLDIDDEAQPVPSRAPSSSPSPPRSTGHGESWDYNQLQANNNGLEATGSDEDSEVAPPPQKRRRSNRRIPSKVQRTKALDLLNSPRKSRSVPKTRRGECIPKKSGQPKKTKKPRRLPVAELVMASQRLDDSGLEDDEDSPLELSQDLISQVSEAESSHDDHRGQIRIKEMSKGRHKGIGPIDISEFRLPAVVSVNSSLHRTPSHSDGFEGTEANPIGRTIPFRGLYRRESRRSIAMKLPELTLVAERPAYPPNTGNLRGNKKNKQLSVVEPQVQQHPPIEQYDRAKVTEVHVELHRSDESLEDGLEGHHDQLNPLIEPVNDYSEKIESDEMVGNEPQDNLHLLVGQEHDQMEDAECQEPERTIDTTRRPQPHSTLLAGRQQDEQINIPKKQLKEAVVDKNHARHSQLNPSTPKGFSSHEQSFERYMSIASPLKRKSQGRPIGKITSLTQPSRKAIPAPIYPGLLVPKSHSQAHAVYLTPKTVKQAKDDLQAMHELSLVSVKRQQPESDDESDSEDELNGGHPRTRDNSPWSGSEESYVDERDDEEEEASEESSSGLVPEQPFNEEDTEMKVDDRQWLKRNSGKDQDGPNMLQERGIIVTLSGQKVFTNEVSVQVYGAQTLERTPKGQQSNVQANIGLLNQPGAQDQNVLPEIQASGFLVTASHGTTSKYQECFYDSWRPRAPLSSEVLIEVEEEIEGSPQNSPMPLARRIRQKSHIYSSRRRSEFLSSQLPLVHSRPVSPNSAITTTDQNGSQGSAILGETQNFVLPETSIPETQFSNESEERQHQVYDIPSYFSQTSRLLNESASKLKLSRAKSSPAHLFFKMDQPGIELMPPSAMFKTTISPVKSTPRLPTLTQQSSTSAASLSTLTRKASLGMGTLPASARNRRVSVISLHNKLLSLNNDHESDSSQVGA